MTIFEKANYLIETIENAGFEAYQVGGCVRDFFMKRKCDDIDITTSAKPGDLEKILAENNIKYIETGLKHGTVTAVFDGDNFEITTYRTDGEYIDNRHPENVSFVSNIDEDLSRRDFTINAIAYNPNKDEIVDLFGGRNDIENKIIKAVGNPDKRFKEDTLRIMRAVRFSSTLGFEIEENTKAALFRNKELLKNVSAERIFTELSKLLLGDNVFDVLTEYKEIMGVIIPELVPIFTCGQNTVWHIFDVYTHTAKTVEQSPRLLSLRLTMLLHDIGKPRMHTVDENGISHFKKHQFEGAYMAEKILKRLRIDNASAKYIYELIWEHDNRIPATKKSVRRFMAQHDFDFVMDYLEVRRADTYAQSDYKRQEKLAELDHIAELAMEIKEDNECIHICDLDINGKDFIQMGFGGKDIGIGLELALNGVIDEKVENKKEELKGYIESNFKRQDKDNT